MRQTRVEGSMQVIAPGRNRQGFSLIELLIAIGIIGILTAIAMFIMAVQPRRAANEASAISTVRTLVTAERVYSATHGQGTYASLTELRQTEMIDQVLATGSKAGYSYTLEAEGDAFAIVARPETERDGTRSFYADQTGVIRFAIGMGGAGPSDEPIG